MAQRIVTIGSRTGLHARPATLFVQAAKAAAVPVRISRDGRPPVDARSILAVLALGATHGAEVTIEADGDGADTALDSLAALLASDLDEPEAGAA
jgi:phosphocarrier protein